MSFNKKSKGFTLIELLVVIAIIGILAAVVLASLSTARNKARDASAQGSMSSMRAQAELGVNTAGQYVGNICSTGATGTLGSLITAVTNTGATVYCGTTGANASSTAAGWGVSATLPTGAFYCVDSTGYAGPSTAASASAEIATGFSSGDVVCDNS